MWRIRIVFSDLLPSLPVTDFSLTGSKQSDGVSVASTWRVASTVTQGVLTRGHTNFSEADPQCRAPVGQSEVRPPVTVTIHQLPSIEARGVKVWQSGWTFL